MTPINIFDTARLVRAARERRGWSRVELAQASGIHWRTIQDLETRDDRGGHWETIVRLVQACGYRVSIVKED